MRSILLPVIAFAQAISLGLAQEAGQWFIFALVILSVLLMLVYLARDFVRGFNEWRQDDEAVMSWLIASNMTHLAPMFLNPRKES